jgi:hypothetical protein
MATNLHLDHDALTRPTSTGSLNVPEAPDDTAADDLAALWLDLGCGD